MANQTISTQVNYDNPSLSGLRIEAGKAITLAMDGVLTMNADTRYGQTSAMFSFVVAQQPSKWIIDGRDIWEIPFESSTGTVPTLSTLNSNPVLGLTSGATGELFRVWSTIPTSPLSSMLVPVDFGNTLPLSGYLKLRTKNGNFLAGETIRLPNNSTIVAKTSGHRSWVNIVAGSANDTIASTAEAKIIGDWYFLGTTNGQDNQQFQFPVSDTCPAIWVETAPNSELYESWLNASWVWDLSAWTIDGGEQMSTITTDSVGKYFGMDPINGVITIAKRTPTSNMGYKPPAGCKVKIGNIILSTCRDAEQLSSNNFFVTSISSTNIDNTFSRHSYSNNQNLYITKATCNWRIDTSSKNSFYLEDVSISEFCRLNFIEKNVNLKNVAVGSTYRYFNNYSLNIDSCKNLVVSGCNLLSTIFDGTGAQSLRNIVCVNRSLRNALFFNNKLAIMNNDNVGNYFNSTLFRIEKTYDSVFEDNAVIGSIGFSVEGSGNNLIKNTKYRNTIAPKSLSATRDIGSAFYAENCKNLTIDGLTFVDEITGFHPRERLGRTLLESENVTFQNIGTFNNPLYTGNGTDSFTMQYLTRDGSLGGNETSSGGYNLKYKNVHISAVNSTNPGHLFLSNPGISDQIVFENVSVLSGTNILRPIYRNFTIKGFRGRLQNTNDGNSYGPNRYGAHFTSCFTSPTSGILMLSPGNPPSETTSTYLSSNFVFNNGNGGGFTGSGDLFLVNQGESIIWEMPFYLLGYTGFSNFNLTKWGTNFSSVFNIIEFQYDKGNGYNGQWIQHSVDSTSTSSPLTAINPIDPNVGFKLKVRITKNNPASSGITTVWWVAFNLLTNIDAQQIPYPQPKQQRGSISNLLLGSRVQIYNITTNSEIYNDIHINSSGFSYEYNNGEEISPGDILRARLVWFNGDKASRREELLTEATSTGFVFFADQEDDAVYNQNAIDGSLVTEFSADYPTIEVDINDLDQQTSIPRLYAWWVANEHTEDGIRNYFGGLIAEDFANYRIITEIVEDFKIDNLSNQGVVFLGNYRLYRDDGGVPVVTTTTGGGSIILYAGSVNITTVDRNVPSLTPQESATLNKINTLPQDTMNLSLTAITNQSGIGARLKDAATVSNVGEIVTTALTI